jgi:hypothetical protein
MEKRQLNKGDILQIIPGKRWGGLFAVVDEPMEWGAKAYLLSPRNFEAHRFQGLALVRLPFEDIELVGEALWLEGCLEEENDPEPLENKD